MGVKGLLPQIRAVTRQVSIKAYRGKVVGVDAKSWLYRAAMTSSEEAGHGETTAAFKTHLENRLLLLQASGVADMIFVFDGCPWGAKAQEDHRRQSVKASMRQKAAAAAAEGDCKHAHALYKKCVEISFPQVQFLTQLLRERFIPFLIAPYEADAQLAFLSKSKAVDLVITEDSDMLPYGCPEIMFKFDNDGMGQVIKRSELMANQSLQFDRWTEKQFIVFCCLCGCDYIPSLPGVGVKIAHQIVSGCADIAQVEQVLLRRHNCGPTYIEQLKRALWTFKHHLVYDPVQRDLVNLSPIDENDEWARLDAESCSGQIIPRECLFDLVTGRIDPRSVWSDNRNATAEQKWGFELSVETQPLSPPNSTSGAVQWMCVEDQQVLDNERATPTLNVDVAVNKPHGRSPILAHQYKSPLLSRSFQKMRPLTSRTNPLTTLPNIGNFLREKGEHADRFFRDSKSQPSNCQSDRPFKKPRVAEIPHGDPQIIPHEDWWTVGSIHGHELDSLEHAKQMRLRSMFDRRG